MSDERLRLGLTRGGYSLELVSEGKGVVIGSIRPLNDDTWKWTANLNKKNGESGYAEGISACPDVAKEDQFDALVSLEPERFQRLTPRNKAVAG